MTGIDPKRSSDVAKSRQRLQSIRLQFGYVDKLVIQPNGQLIGGEGRVEAIKRLAWVEIQCRVVAGLSPAGYKALALNRIPENSG